jgi:release factor glutamine methyltransferase
MKWLENLDTKIINIGFPRLAMTIQEHHRLFISTLTPSHGEGEAKSIARILFEDYFSLKLDKLDQGQDDLFNGLLAEEYEKIIARLLKQEPIQYIVGFAWFYGLKLKVNPTVLIPRPETEELVHWILQTIKSEKLAVDCRILDIGTGSGCIPIALKRKSEGLKLMAVDVSESALITASRNANRYEMYDIDFKKVDILIPSECDLLPKFDLIVSNPPYIPNREKLEMADNVLEYEPHLALFVENEDALIFYNRIADFGLSHLNTGGYLFFECNEFNAQEVAAVLVSKGYLGVALERDMSGKERMVRAMVG